MLDTLQPGDIVLADRYYASYWLIAELISRNVHVIFGQHAARKTDFRKGKRLGARDHVVEWTKPRVRPKWMKQEEYDNYPQAFSIRETRSNGKILVTTFLSAKEVSKKEISTLFIQRWHVELDLRNIKTTLGMEKLSCMTPEMNVKEMWSYFLGYNLIRLLMCEAAEEADIVPRQISFKHTLQLWNSWSLWVRWADEIKQMNMLYVLIAEQRVGDRPDRVEPRAVKRRPKPYPRLMKPREEARENVRRYGHPKKIR
ncbi:MAG: transposase [Desulfobulbaceae bacterium]|nr:transposase [Desulfobulbaceae bacterium]